MSVLIGQGYRKFAFVAGDMQYRVNQNRSEGCYAALKQYGLDMEQQCYYTDFRNSEPIENYICDMIEKRVECIVCADDVICTRFMSCLQAQGYRIPDDMESYHCVTVPVWSALSGSDSSECLCKTDGECHRKTDDQQAAWRKLQCKDNLES